MNAEQRALQFHCAGQALVGILDVPERPLARGVLLVGCGDHFRVGSHRHYTLMARLLVARGFPVLRFDCRGMGDSEGEHTPGAATDDDIAAAIGEFFLQMPTLTEVVLWGLGDSATAAALYAPADARVRGLILLAPGSATVAAPARPLLPQLLSRFGEIGFWNHVGVGQTPALDLTLPLAQRTIASLACFDGAALLVTGSDDAAGLAMAELVARHDSACRRVTVAGADHTFASRAWRDHVAELSANWLVSW